MGSLNSLKRYFRFWVTYPKMLVLRKEFKNRPFRLLDVGAGNHSATYAKKFFPNCDYFGVDISRDYNNDENDFALMKDFYELDLTRLQFESIPNAFFDAILMAHLIEHLPNGDKVIEGLIPKLKKGGIIYVEYPGLKSTKLPSMRESLNFHDDPSHVRLYSVAEISNLFVNAGVTVVRGGTRRNWRFILLMPLLLPYRYIIRGHFVGGDFWDLLGFAEYVLGRKQ